MKNIKNTVKRQIKLKLDKFMAFPILLYENEIAVKK
jgi:hypothetical protein